MFTICPFIEEFWGFETANNRLEAISRKIQRDSMNLSNCFLHHISTFILYVVLLSYITQLPYKYNATRLVQFKADSLVLA